MLMCKQTANEDFKICHKRQKPIYRNFKKERKPLL